MIKPNITLHIEKLKSNCNQNNIKTDIQIIEPFQGIYKKNSRIIFLILLFLISFFYMKS